MSNPVPFLASAVGSVLSILIGQWIEQNFGYSFLVSFWLLELAAICFLLRAILRLLR